MCINNNFLCQGSKTLLNFPQDKFKIETCVQETKSCSVKVLKSSKTEVFAAKSFNFVMSKHRFTFSKGFSNQSTDECESIDTDLLGMRSYAGAGGGVPGPLGAPEPRAPAAPAPCS